MKKRILSFLTALALCLTLLPVAALADGTIDGTQIPEGLKIEGTTVTGYTGTATELTIPDGVTAIGSGAFSGNGTLTSVTLPESVTTIGENAFANMSSLKSIVMPGVTVIEEEAFRYAESLTSVTVPKVTEIGVQAFEFTALTQVELPEVRTISKRAFRDSALESIDMPKVETIGEMAFGDTQFTSFTVPDSVKEAGATILYNVPLETLTISLNTLLTAEFDQRTFSEAFYTYDDYEIILTGVDRDITLLENGVATSEKSVTFEKGSLYDDVFHITTVADATGGTVTNQTGQPVTVNGETVANNSAKPVGTAAAGDAYLANLSLSATYILPDFGNLTADYTALVDYTVASTDVTAVPSNPEATVTINGTTVASEDSYTVEIPLNEGNNIITVAVTAPDGSEETYTIALEKMPAPASVQISTPEELMAFAEAVNNGEYNNVTNVVVELTDNIDLEGYNWTPIGDTEYNYFSGTFEGNGYTIRNLTINKTTSSGYFGLFGVTDAAIQNVNVSGTLTNTAADYGSCIGVIAGYLGGGTIKNCNTSGFTISSDVSLGICVGGIVGEADYSVIENCVSGTDISILPYGYVGGVAGAAVGTQVVNCTYNGTICFSGGSYVGCGGIVGTDQESSEVAYCTNNGSIDVSQRTSALNTTIGGIVGELYSGQIHHSTNNGGLDGLALRMGGIAGLVDDGTVDNCLNRGTISSTAQSGSTYAGGIAGTVRYSDASVTNCVSVGDVTGTSSYHPITSYAVSGAEFSNNYYDSSLPSSGDIPDSVTNGSTGAALSDINSGEMVNVINSLGGAYRLGADGTIEIVPLSYVLTIEGSTADASGAGEYEAGAQVAIDAGSRSGYRFAGWTVTSGSGELADAASAQTTFTMPAEAVTLTASWTAVSSSGSNTYPPKIQNSEHGSVSISPKFPSRGDTVTITPDADEGYKVASVTVTDSKGNLVEVTDNGDGTYSFIQPTGKVTVAVSFTEVKQPAELFTDVPESAYYYDAVLWAVDIGVTEGTTATTFSPDAPCTRAQAVTFLWRAAGSPEPESGANPFTDIQPGAYYYKAVLWAVETGITNGTSAVTFSPDATVTRAQTVTFLWRFAGTKATGSNPFTDVADSAYYAEAVIWAVERGITNGTSATIFSPDEPCTRAQIVTFLYRAEV